MRRWFRAARARLRGRSDHAAGGWRTLEEQALSALFGSEERVRFRLGALHAAHNRQAAVTSVHDAEFQVFSQFGEDGIIQFLIGRCPGISRSFVEFGVEDYTESNTRFLLQHDNWRGLIMDPSAQNMARVRQSELSWRHDLTALQTFVSTDNINDILREHGFGGQIGLLSIDIDGNDYWVWQSIEAADPSIVVVEYNSAFGSSRPVSVPYDPSFRRTSAHFSNLYWGCSLPALCHLGEKKGYRFVGSNTAGNNAFFVKDGVAPGIAGATASDGYVHSRFRESRDEAGRLTFLSGWDRLRPIADLPLVDVYTGERLAVRQLPEFPEFKEGSSGRA